MCESGVQFFGGSVEVLGEEDGSGLRMEVAVPSLEEVAGDALGEKKGWLASWRRVLETQ